MKVKTALEALQTLVNQGHGEVELLGTDCRSGDTAAASIYADVKEVTGEEMAGEILDMEVGTKYVSVFMG